MEVSKGAKIKNRYNQVPHLTQDTNGKEPLMVEGITYVIFMFFFSLVLEQMSFKGVKPPEVCKI